MARFNKIIFLDYDGVLSCHTTMRELCLKKKDDPNPERSKYNFHGVNDVPGESQVRCLNKITDTTEAVFVISSTIRVHYRNRFVDMRGDFHCFGITGRILDYTPWLGEKQRGNEIQAWLDSSRVQRMDNSFKFVILDDERSDMYHIEPYLVQTSMANGLTEELADEAIRRLQ